MAAPTLSKSSPRTELPKEAALPPPPMNGRFDELEQSSNSSNTTSRLHHSEGTPTSATISRYTLVPAGADDFIIPVQESTANASQSTQTDEPEEDEPMEEDDPIMPSSQTQVQSTSQPQHQLQSQPLPQPLQPRIRNSSLPKAAPLPPPNPLSEVEVFLGALKPDLSSLVPTFKELGIKDGEYLDGLRSIPRKDNKEWFDELTAKGLFTPFQAHVILRALYN